MAAALGASTRICEHDHTATFDNQALPRDLP